MKKGRHDMTSVVWFPIVRGTQEVVLTFLRDQRGNGWMSCHWKRVKHVLMPR
ncbi:unnamed protein product [Periconia digitata]|uniref:Uncharacterized protein n=1 Tax=Periconia digitata TaxID=1303443 RepID=A0A9W4XT67_9PLEO|nr:unnamed protein product [Periconia digitata]